MNQYIKLVALIGICSTVMVSCKSKTNEPTVEEIQEYKVALADSVLAKIDVLTEDYIKVSDSADIFKLIVLTDEDKAKKPDYLLDPGQVTKFVSRKQKINALAIYEVEFFVRHLYDMPTKETEDAISTLVVELDHPILDIKNLMDWEKPASELIREEYDICVENGTICYFWQHANAMLCETEYLLAKDPELFFRKINSNILYAYKEQWLSFYRAIWALSPYDEEMNKISQYFNVKSPEQFVENGLKDFDSLEKCIQTYKSDKYHPIEVRNALLQ